MKNNKILRLVVCISLILTIVSSLALSACAKETQPTTSAPTTPAPTTPGATTPVATTPAPTTKPAPVPSAEVFKWRLQHQSAPGIEYDTTGTDFAKLVEQASNGRILLTPYYSGQIVSGTDIPDAVSKNVIECGMASGSYWAGVVPETDIEGGIPMAWTNIQDFGTLWYDMGLLDILREAVEEKGNYFVDTIMTGSINFWSKKPINSVADLKGLKIRLFGRHLDLMNAMGASAVFIAHQDVYTALQTGTIDASGTSAFVYKDQKYYEICKYFVKEPSLIFPSTIGFYVNLSKWNSLPSDLQTLMHVLTRWVSYQHNRTAKYSDEKMFQEMAEKYGTEFCSLGPEDIAAMTAAALPLLDEAAAKTARSAQMVKIIKDYMKAKGLL
ncbi:MAG: TRAP transporter substrate-binding protein DctP [Dehalococcoidales bacterium]|nr:TRAP transporter substrate-binding protein DctP [Dehalococcoidales bacterium]